MKKFNFVSDLDKTLIYLENEKYVCVEYKDNKPLTYMTKKSVDLLNEIIKNNSTNFIPCTLRSYELATRIDFIRNNFPKYMICDGGARIYINGKLDEDYNDIINLNQNADKLKNILLKIEKMDIFNRKKILVSNDQSFFTIVFERNIDSKLFFYELEKNKEHFHDFIISLQERKVYIIPNNISKEFALNYLINKYKLVNVITAGDSNVDKNFVALGNYKIVPKHAEFLLENAIYTKNSDILAGEEILSKVSDIIKIST